MNLNTTTDPDEIEEQAAVIAQAKMAQLVAAGLDINAMAEDEISEALKAIVTDEEIRILGISHINHLVPIVMGEKIVETLRASGFNIYLPDIAPSVTAYLEYLAAEEAERAA